MFQLSQQDIHLGAAASDKQDAIRQVAAALTQAGRVSAGYVDGMLARELQTSTYPWQRHRNPAWHHRYP